jgi:hypothetical protein
MVYNQFVGRGGKLSLSSTKSDLETIILRATEIPGPGSYDLISATASPPKGGRISTGSQKSDLDFKLLRAAKTPGPGTGLRKDGGILIHSDGHQMLAGAYCIFDEKVSGGRLSSSKIKTEIE